jgi:hypothetical protein
MHVMTKGGGTADKESSEFKSLYSKMNRSVMVEHITMEIVLLLYQICSIPGVLCL